MSETNKKFFGPDEIAMAAETDRTTELGSSVVKVTFTNGKDKYLPKKVLEGLVSESISDMSSLRTAKFTKMIPIMMQVIGEYDIAYEDLEGLMSSLKTTFAINFNKAIYFALHKTVEGFDTASYPTDTMLYSEMYEILKSISKDETIKHTAEGEPAA